MTSQLMFFPYLQDWDGERLKVRLLAAPQGSPLDPLMAGEPSFADAAFTLEVQLVQGLGAVPTRSSPAQTLSVPLPASPQAARLCQALDHVLPIDKAIPPVDPRSAGARFLKYAPPGYRDATGYSGSGSPYLVTDDRYHCALKAPAPAGTVIKTDPPKLPWGKVMALALRQPLLAERLGLIRPLDLVPPAGFFEEGGWVYVSLAAGSPGAGLLGVPDGLKLYAARVPPLSGPRSLFTSVLFPVAALPPPASYDALFREVIDYDDGFAKAVYAQQPLRVDPLGEEDDASRPLNDHGIQLGWDDEQVATWLNRQIDPAAAVQDAPMGVLGYRVDARRQGEVAWHSLILGRTELSLDGLDLGDFSGEFQVEIAPNKLMGDPSGTFWLPVYYTAWRGPSLVGPDRVAAALHGLNPDAVVNGVDPDLPLRYGQTYDFRVRLVDHTGGGPRLNETPSNPAPQPVAPMPFRRYVRPGNLRTEGPLPVVPDPANPAAAVKVHRPLLGYPAYVYAGGTAADLLGDLAPAQVEHRAVGLPDPDVNEVEIDVQVEFPGQTGGFMTLYRTTRAFPAGRDDALDLSFDWQDLPDASALTSPAAGPLPLPTSRHVRLSLRALASDRPDYYGAEDVRRGPDTLVSVYRPADDERALLRSTSLEAVQGLFLQPEVEVDLSVAGAQKLAGKALAAPDNALGRLATALELDESGLGLRARAGRRVLFGCSATLHHTLGPDGGSLMFGSVGDLTRLWLIPLRLELQRDWSWDGLAYLRIVRDGQEVGRLEPRRSVAHEALSAVHRGHSEVVFLDALDPKPAAGQLPRELHLQYRIEPVFLQVPAQLDAPLDFELHLPITTPPAQVPRLVSAGLALTPYEHNPQYSATGLRGKSVWLEFEAAPENPDDLYFARVLASAPDPVLTHDLALPEVAEPPLPVDPEPIRVITPGQSDDQAGLGAMQDLIPTDSPRHFLLPLPPGLTADDPALFGFFTYELRLGHKKGWSTAQGRYGRPLHVTGVQHPAPTLQCAVTRDPRGIEITVPLANPVLGTRSVRPFPPVTQLWVLLYAQVWQADGSIHRNVLLGHRAAVPQVERWEGRHQKSQVETGTATFSSSEVVGLLELIGLGPDTPLSCLAVETLPGEQANPDPIGTGLGYERFLRTSPLTEVPAVCCC